MATPLLFVPGLLFPYVVPKALYFRVVTELGLLVFLFLLLRRSPRAAPGRDPVLWLLAGWVLWSVVAAVFGASPWRSFFGDYERMWGVLTSLHFLLFYLLLRSVLDTGQWLRLLRFALVVAAVVVLVALAQRVAPELGLALPGGGRGRLFGTLGNPGYLAAYLLLILPMTTVVWHRTAGGRPGATAPGRRLAYLFFVLAAAFVFLLAGTRAATVGLAVGVAVAAVWWAAGGSDGMRGGRRRGSGEGRRRVVWVALGLSGSVAVVAALGAATGLPAVERLAGTTLESPGLKARLVTWASVLPSALEHPLVGVGPENFQIAFDRHFDPTLYGVGTATHWDRAHNAFLGALVTAGFPGLLLYAGLFAVLLREVWLGGRDGSLTALEAASVGGGMVAYLVYLFFWFEDHGSMVPFLLLAGWVVHRRRGPLVTFAGGPDGGAGRAKSGLVLGAGGLVVLLLAYQQAVRPWRAASAAARADALVRPGQWTSEPDRTVEGLRAYREALRLNPAQRWQVLLRYVGDVDALTARPRRLSRHREVAEEVERGFVRAGELMEAELRHDPRNSRIHLKKNQLYRAGHRLTGQRQLYRIAVRSARRAIELAPEKIRYRHVLAQTHLQDGRTEEAEAALREALDIYGAYGETHYLLGRIHLERGRPMSALGSTVTAMILGYSVEDAGFVLRLGRRFEQERPARAARLYGHHLERRYPVYRGLTGAAPSEERAERGAREGTGRQDEEEELEPFRYRGGDLRVAARLPLLHLRLGEARSARATARRFLVGVLATGEGATRAGPTGLPGPSEEARSETVRRTLGFLEALRSGRAGEWAGEATLLAERAAPDTRGR